MAKQQKPATRAIRIQTTKTSQKEHSSPVFLTSSFTYDSAEDMAAAFAGLVGDYAGLGRTGGDDCAGMGVDGAVWRWRGCHARGGLCDQ